MTQRLWAGTARNGERRDEAQVPSATSRPVPLRTGGLEDRDIDDCSHCPKPLERVFPRSLRLVFRSARGFRPGTRDRRQWASTAAMGSRQASSALGLGAGEQIGPPGLIDSASQGPLEATVAGGKAVGAEVQDRGAMGLEVARGGAKHAGVGVPGQVQVRRAVECWRSRTSGAAADTREVLQ